MITPGFAFGFAVASLCSTRAIPITVPIPIPTRFQATREGSTRVSKALSKL
jgi:hypothetical protein